MIQVVVEPSRLAAGQQAELVLRLTNTGQGPCRNIVFKLRRPISIPLLRGSDRVEIGQLGAGETFTHSIRIRPKTVGTWILTSVNFSYRDHNGMSCRDDDFAAELTVVAATVVEHEPEPEFTAELVDTALPYGDWTEVHGRLHNTGRAVLRSPAVRLSGPIDTDPDNKVLDTLGSGGRADFSFYVRARASGQVPVRVDTSYTDRAGHRQVHSRTVALQVRKPGTEDVRSTGSGHQVRVLYLAANPTDTHRVLWDRELREIRGTIRAGEWRDQLSIESRTASRVRDISQALLDTDPRIVHFSGHGSDGNFYAENDVGGTRRVTPSTMAALFGATTTGVECVIVNACDTEEMARTLATNIDYVIGMRQTVNDGAAIEFSIGFYMALAANRPIELAFKLGCAHVQARDALDQRTPVLFHRNS